jgi:hypothetical protein
VRKCTKSSCAFFACSLRLFVAHSAFMSSVSSRSHSCASHEMHSKGKSREDELERNECKMGDKRRLGAV